MGDAWVVNSGVDTLVLNAFHTDANGRPIKMEVAQPLKAQLDEWKRIALEQHEEYPTSWMFNDAVLHMFPNGAGRGQWPWMLQTKDIVLYISGGHWNGIASVRLGSHYLWSCRSVQDAIVQVQVFLDDIFGDEMYLQVSLIDLCADVVGWQDISQLDRSRHFVTRSRKRGVYEETAWGTDVTSRDYALGLQRTGFDFARDKRGSSPLSCRIYDKTRELRGSGKEWFEDLWRSRGWTEEDGPVWRVEFSFKRDALHELMEEDAAGNELFHGVEDAYELLDRLPLLWAYAAGQVGGGMDGLPDGWLRCVVPGEDKSRARWPVHPVWQVIQVAFSQDMETPPHFGKIVRKRWEDHNINKGIEAVIGYLTSLAAWAGGELAEEGVDLSIVLHWLAAKGGSYLERVDRDFSAEVQRKRIKFGKSGGQYGAL